MVYNNRERTKYQAENKQKGVLPSIVINITIKQPHNSVWTVGLLDASKFQATDANVHHFCTTEYKKCG